MDEMSTLINLAYLDRDMAFTRKRDLFIERLAEPFTGLTLKGHVTLDRGSWSMKSV